MKRVKDTCGVVHFCGAREGVTLCGIVNSDLFHAPTPFVGTSEPVTCVHCATLYNKIKCAPWNEVDGETLGRGIYMAAPRKYCGSCACEDCEKCGTEEIVECERYICKGGEA